MFIVCDYPGLINRPCSECKQWLYEPHGSVVNHSKKLLNRKVGTRDFGKPYPNLEGRTPCDQCPKESPEKAKGPERTYHKALALISFYEQVQATCGRILPSKLDLAVSKALGLVSAAIRRKQTNDLAERVGYKIQEIIPRLLSIAIRR